MRTQLFIMAVFTDWQTLNLHVPKLWLRFTFWNSSGVFGGNLYVKSLNHTLLRWMCATQTWIKCSLSPTPQLSFKKADTQTSKITHITNLYFALSFHLFALSYPHLLTLTSFSWEHWFPWNLLCRLLSTLLNYHRVQKLNTYDTFTPISRYSLALLHKNIAF